MCELLGFSLLSMLVYLVVFFSAFRIHSYTVGQTATLSKLEFMCSVDCLCCCTHSYINVCMHIVCTFNAVYIFMCRFGGCCRCCCCCCWASGATSFASMVHSMLDFVCIVLSMCLGDNVHAYLCV